MLNYDDPFVAFSKMRDKIYANDGLMVLEGRLVIKKALECGIKLFSVLCVPQEEDYWKNISKDSFPVKSLHSADMAKLVDFKFHRGSIALAYRPNKLSNDNLVIGNKLVLWNVTDPDNLGTLIRTSCALGAKSVVLGGGCADPYARKALRASMGCALKMPIYFADNVEDLQKLNGENNILLSAALVEDAISVKEFTLDKNKDYVSLILGNEGWGLPKEVLDISEKKVIIPMHNNTDSLNVASCGAILMYSLFTK